MNTDTRVAQRQSARTNDARKKIILLTAAILIAMVLFPPKGISTPSMFGGTQQGTHWGYYFVTSDPAAEAHGANDPFGFGQLVQGYIEWGRLIVQLAVVSILGFVGIKALENIG